MFSSQNTVPTNVRRNLRATLWVFGLGFLGLSTNAQHRGRKKLTTRWWLYTGSFVVGIGSLIAGLATANPVLVVIGAAIGFALFFLRKYVQPD